MIVKTKRHSTAGGVLGTVNAQIQEAAQGGVTCEVSGQGDPTGVGKSVVGE